MSEGLGVYYCDNEDSLTWLGLINDFESDDDCLFTWKLALQEQENDNGLAMIATLNDIVQYQCLKNFAQQLGMPKDELYHAMAEPKPDNDQLLKDIVHALGLSMPSGC